MGLFSSSSKQQLPWINIESVEQLEAILTGEKDKPFLIFKHSTRCGVSSMALNSFEGEWTTENELCDLYFVDLLKHRDVSNAIAEKTGITHQSPQVIAIRGKEIIYDATHSAISGRQLATILKKG